MFTKTRSARQQESRSLVSAAVFSRPQEDFYSKVLLRDIAIHPRPSSIYPTEIFMSNNRPDRAGTATVEAAFCLPFIFLLVGATIQLSTTIYLKESLTIAAYEGARFAVTRRATDEAVLARMQQILTDRGVTFGDATLASQVTISPAASDATLLQPITVSVSAPTAGNTVAPFRGLTNLVLPEVITADVVMRKEFTFEVE